MPPESPYRRFVRTFPVAAFVLDGEGRFTDVNPALSELWGGASAELLGRPFTELMAPADRERGRRLCEGEAWAGGEIRILTRSGEERICRLHMADLGEPGGEPGCHGVMLDVTETRRTEEALRASKDQFRLMVEGSEEVFFFVHDRDGVFEYLSPSVESVVGYPPEAMVGRSYEDFHPAGSIRDEVRRRTGEGLKGEPRSPYEAVLWHREGRLIHLEITESPLVEDGEIRGMRGFARDVTERKRLEAELLHSQKMEAVGRLAGGVAHDFNNLLTTISGHVELALDRLEEGEAPREELEEVGRSSERAAHLTRQLLAFSRKQVLHPRVVDLNEVVTDLKRLLERVIGEDIGLVTELAPGPLHVLADAGQLDQVLMNLAVNARDAMPTGGYLRISTHRLAPGEASGGDGAGSREADPVQSGRIRLSVTDTGVGMTERVKARAFEPFFTTKAQGRGTGLGLSTVYGIVQQTGGSIVVETRPGEGTTFHVDLVEAAAPDRDAEPLPAPVEPAPGDARILVVEDEPGVRSLCLKLLERQGYSAVGAADGQQALDLLSKGEGFDVVLTDVVMPGMSGPEMLEEARNRDPGIRAVIMSGYAEEAVTRDGVVTEAAHFLEKPFSSGELLQAVASALADGPEAVPAEARPAGAPSTTD